MRLQADSLIDGRYKVAERIGSGGMADVYRAQDTVLHRTVALKILHSRFAADEDFVERFRREASAAAGLQHPNVVGVYDRGGHEGTYYIAMEYVKGPTLKQHIVDGTLTVERAVGLVQQILAGAAFAHRRGVIHRDLKPQNVIVDAEGRAQVTDFGIARAGASDITQTGSVLGTAHYLSPEQAQGQPTEEPSDVYSVGVILYEALTGRLPFEGDSAVAVALKQVSEEPVPPSEIEPSVPPALDPVVLRALAKDPERRFQTAREFSDALAAAARGEPVGGSTAAFAPVAGPPPRTRRRWAWVALGLLLVALAVGALTTLFGNDVAVPRVVGQAVGPATTELEDRGFEVDLRTVERDAPRDIVLEQDPAGGQQAKEGSRVTLTVSAGPGRAEIPGTRGVVERTARRRIERAGFEVRIRRQADEGLADGIAVGTRPSSGSDRRKGTTVTLLVSTGPDTVAVPTLVGRTRAQAEGAIRDLGLTPRVTERDDEAEAGEVLSQAPAAGTRAEKGDTVSIVVSTGQTPVRVRDVEGRSRQTARELLAEQGLKVEVRTREVDKRSDDGIVLGQSPGARTEVPEGSTVVITVGEFTEPEPESPAPEDPEPAPDPPAGAAPGARP
ncbi:MAG: protein kinase domain-containing protein [Solirubrobacterales bacterium]